jgi:hypothetical protein
VKPDKKQAASYYYNLARTDPIEALTEIASLYITLCIELQLEREIAIQAINIGYDQRDKVDNEKE